MTLLGMCRSRMCGRAIGTIGTCLLVTAIGCEQTAAPKAGSMSAVSATKQDAVAGAPVRQAPTVVVRDADGHPSRAFSSRSPMHRLLRRKSRGPTRTGRRPSAGTRAFMSVSTS
jgi:hypothetical protein